MGTFSYRSSSLRPPVPLVGDRMPVPCADGAERPNLSLNAAASTAALEPVHRNLKDEPL